MEPSATRALTIPEVADRLNLSTRTIMRMIESGILPAFWTGAVGTSPRVREQDLEQHIADRLAAAADR